MINLRQSSFTLIEILVVISIVSILAALLFPSLQSAKSKANRIKCLNNVRQIGLAIEYYKEDNDQYFPFKPPTAYTYWDKYAYMNILGSNYMKSNWDVFRCPANKNEIDGITVRTNSLGGRMDYEINSGVFKMNINGTNEWGARITLPTIASVLFDYPPPHYWTGVGGSVVTSQMPHNAEGCNVYYVDGHAAWLTMDDSQKTIEGKTPFYMWGRFP